MRRLPPTGQMRRRAGSGAAAHGFGLMEPWLELRSAYQPHPA
jgi:hypothetical protein